MMHFLESVVIFAFVLGIWAIISAGVATMASHLPTQELVRLVGGGATMLGLFVAVGVAARLVRRRSA